jgi:hypothetical protein
VARPGQTCTHGVPGENAGIVAEGRFLNFVKF